MKFGENLKLIRKNKNISQEVLAEKLNVSRQSISKWETGENYPSMSNIMSLCNIFHCPINALVHEDLEDLKFLDEDIKMNVVKFKKDEQKKMKGLSKAIYVLARIFKIVSTVLITASILLTIASIILIPNIKINKEASTVTIFKEDYKYTLNDELSIFKDKKKIIILSDIKVTEIDTINDFLDKPTSYQLPFALMLSVSLGLTGFMLYKLLSYVEKLFMNIHDKDTPFNLDNTYYIKKIALYLTLVLLVPDLLGSLAEVIFNINLGVSINMTNYLIALIVLAIAYIFKYGYEIQLDSNSKMYD